MICLKDHHHHHHHVLATRLLPPTDYTIRTTRLQPLIVSWMDVVRLVSGKPSQTDYDQQVRDRVVDIVAGAGRVAARPAMIPVHGYATGDCRMYVLL